MRKDYFDPSKQHWDTVANKVVRIAILGPVGNGKSVLALSLFKAVFHGDARGRVTNLRLSSRLRQLLEGAKGKKLPDRTVVEESLSFSWMSPGGEVDVEVLCLAGEDLRSQDQLSAAELRSRLDLLRVDIVVIAVNPHEVWSELSERALGEMMVTWLRLGFSLGQALDQSSQLLYGRGLADLVERNLGLADVDQRLLDLQPARSEPRPADLDALLEAAEVAAADRRKIRRTLHYLARAVCEDSGELALLRDLAASFPRVILCLTHIDLLLNLMPHLSRDDYEQPAREFLPSNRRRLASDVVLAHNLHLELHPERTPPTLFHGVLPNGGEQLWRALEPHVLECHDTVEVGNMLGRTWPDSRQLLLLGFGVSAALSLIFVIASLVLSGRNEEFSRLAAGFGAICMALLGCICWSAMDDTAGRKTTIADTARPLSSLEPKEAPAVELAPAAPPFLDRVNAHTNHA